MTVRLSVKSWWYAVPLALVLQACGGGGGATGADPATAQSGTGDVDSARLRAISGVTSGITSSSVAQWTQIGPISDQDAARFLTQATFGPTPADVASVKSLGYSGWLAEQLAKPLPAQSYVSYFDMRNAEWMALPGGGGRAGPTDITDPIWRNAIAGVDQLRQRVALALSEIFVVSLFDTCVDNNKRGAASYMDMLTRNALGDFRQLLQDVTLHPTMGCFLSHVANQKDDPVTGRVPDENFAREVMQLFSIGLYQLNIDGTPVVANGAHVPAYGPNDITGMARVVTGFSFACPRPYEDACFMSGGSTAGGDPDMWIKPMVAYDRFHSTLPKTFLGKTIAAQDAANAWASLRVALDTLAAHPNVGPFLGKQLIQRLVTSNPSPAYVARVATAFNKSKGNIGATVQAVLMDPEARNTANALASDSFGKVREPILRMTAVLRALDGRSMTGRYMVGWTPEADHGLGQAPLMAPSVFNFFRPGYVASGSLSAGRGLVAPELQIANETSVAGYANSMLGLLIYGQGSIPNFGAGLNGVKLPDVYLDSQRNASSNWRALTDNPEQLVETLNQRLMYGTMPDGLRQDILTVVKSITDPRPEVRQHDRFVKAVLIIVTSPEFLVQR